MMTDLLKLIGIAIALVAILSFCLIAGATVFTVIARAWEAVEVVTTLTAQQTVTVQRAANLLPPAGRDRFLQSVNNILPARPTDADVAYTLGLVLDGYGIAVGRAHLTDPDSKLRSTGYAKRKR